MRLSRLGHNSKRYYQQYYKLIAFAVVIMTAVIYGSLILGDSVRGTLVDRVDERLGNAETIITSGTSFLNEEIMSSHLLANADAYLMTDGFVSVNGKLIPVYVWGNDKDSIPYGEAIINEPLANKLTDEDFVLHLPSHSLVPSGTLFVTQSYSTQLRLHTHGIKTVKEGGNLYLRNEQTLPLNVFMNRQELAEIMVLEGKVNLIMSPEYITESQLIELWNPAISGLKVNNNVITTDRIFIQEEVVDTLYNILKNKTDRKVLAYLVNDIYTDTDSVPYSFVSATDFWKNSSLKADEMILSDYTANRLNIFVGDSVSIDYFVSKDFKKLETRKHSFIVKDIVPLDEIAADSLLSAEFPGLSNVERCADWDSDLPINMDHIKKIDEDYWYAYHQTPKAIVSYEAIADDWSTSFGSATALQIENAEEKTKALKPQQFGIVAIQPRESGIYAATHGTDFSSLFLALGFFIILSGILLMQNPLVEMFTERKDEIEIYYSLGFTNKRIYDILLKESLRVIIPSIILGIIVGFCYAAIILFLLSNVWSGATHTEGFGYHINYISILISFVIGLIICLLTAYYSIKRVLKDKYRKIEAKQNISKPTLGYIGIIACFGLFSLNLIVYHSIVIFVICGILWLIASSVLLLSYIYKKANAKSNFERKTLIWKTLAAQKSQVLLSYEALAIGIFTVFAVGLNRPDFSHSVEESSITGGYNLWCDSRIPIEYDLNSKEVHNKLALKDLAEGTTFMQCLKHTQDEASCLNLNKVSTPTVLGISLGDIQGFGVDTTLLSSNNIQGVNNYPVLIDQEALIWSLMKSVGDTLHYSSSNGEPINLIIAGTYPTGIFHGSALMNKNIFRKIWKEESGSKIFLVRTNKEEETKNLLEIALSQYGVSICTTTERIEQFFSVTDTYLAIFLTLGGLGMIIGIFCLIIVIRKNLVSRRLNIDTMRCLGFDKETIRQQLYKENIIVPITAIAAGAIGSIISISANATGAGCGTILTAVILLVAIVVLVHLGIKIIINNYISKLK